MNTAADDGRIKRNPCRVKGAGQYRTPERPTATVSQVFCLAELVPARFRVLVLAAAMIGVRWGELIALRRCDPPARPGGTRLPADREDAAWRDGGEETVVRAGLPSRLSLP